MAKLEAFMGRAVGDMGAGLHAVLVLLGDRLGLYKAMADGSPITPNELATSWIPALDGVADKLNRGGKVADIGCGLGASTIRKSLTRSR